MRVLILCEGKTDAILISYLLEHTSGWEYDKHGDSKIRIKAEEISDESINWYRRNKDLIMLCGVGGKDKFGIFFGDKIFPAMKSYGELHCFDKLVYVVDRDEDSDAKLISRITSDLAPIECNVKLGVWQNGKYADLFGKINNIEILSLIIPQDQEGALETVLLDAISQDVYNKKIVDRCIKFIVNIRPISSKYIKNPRLELKAKLSSVFAVISPQKVFSLIDELIKSVKWENYPYIKKLFNEIIKL